MENKTNKLSGLQKFLFVIIPVLAVVLALMAQFYMTDRVYTDAELNAKVSTQVDPLKAEIESIKADATEKDAQIAVKNADLEKALADIEALKAETPTESSILGYIIDKLTLGSVIASEDVSDRELSKLQDSKVEFIDHEYEIEEVYSIKDMLVAINENDYMENSYLNVFKDGIEYNVVFDSDLNTSKISNEDPLEFNFLGKEIKVTNWDGTEVTFNKATRYTLNEGQSVTIDGKVLTISVVSDNDNVFIDVDGQSKELNEGETKTINGLQVYCDNVIFNSVTPRLMATIEVAKDVEETITDGDEYEEDSIWEYVVTTNSIGIKLNEDFTDIDEDEDHKALATGQGLCLPNEYVCVKYDGIVEETFEPYNFVLDNGVLEAKGKFQAGLKDYSKIYINDSKAYEDSDLEDEITDVIKMDSSDEVLTLGVGDISFESIVIAFNSTDVTSVTVDGNDVSSKEDNYRSVYGSIIEDAENNIDNNEVRISMPQEALEATISVM